MRAVSRSHEVGQALHRLRRENGWTLATVSEKTGVAVSTLSKIEKSQTSPNYDVLVRLCETGESVHFDARMPHATVAEGDADALVLVVSQTDNMLTEREYAGVNEE